MQWRLMFSKYRFPSDKAPHGPLSKTLLRGPKKTGFGWYPTEALLKSLARIIPKTLHPLCSWYYPTLCMCTNFSLVSCSTCQGTGMEEIPWNKSWLPSLNPTNTVEIISSFPGDTPFIRPLTTAVFTRLLKLFLFLYLRMPFYKRFKQIHK